MAAQTSFARDIRPLFRPEDVEHMKPMGVPLDDYDYMSKPGNAKLVYESLTPSFQPPMPLGGPYWSQQQLDLFNKWIQEGCPP